LNGNGVEDDVEPRLAGWEFLVEGPGAGGAPGNDSITVVTGPDGSFLVVPNPPIDPEPPLPWCWDYTVTETLKSGWTNTDPGGGTLSKEVTICALDTEATECKFGNRYTGGNGDGDGNGGTVGGSVGRIDKFGILAPWLGMGLIVIVGLGGLGLRRLKFNT